jgi:hypothetical protein
MMSKWLVGVAVGGVLYALISSLVLSPVEGEACWSLYSSRGGICGVPLSQPLDDRPDTAPHGTLKNDTATTYVSGVDSRSPGSSAAFSVSGVVPPWPLFLAT